MILKRLSRNLQVDGEVGGASVPSPSKKVAEVRQPTKEELSVDFTDGGDLGIGEVDKTTPDKKVETPAPAAKKEEKKEEKPVLILPPKKEEKKEEPAAPVEKKVVPGLPEMITPPTATPKSRDYSGFTEEETRVLRAMSNEAFEYSARVFKEAKELGKLKNSQFLQHPEAYTLDPEYKSIQIDSYLYDKEAQHWQEQLIAISEGKEWTPLLKFEKGQPVYGAPQQPTKLAEERVRLAMNNCYQLAQQSGVKAQQFASDYQNRVNQDTAAVHNECKSRFGWVANPEMLEAKLNIPGVGEKTIKEVKETFSGLFPPYLRNSIGVDVAGHLWVALQIYGAQIRELQAGKEVAEIKAEEVTRAEPSSVSRPSAEGKAINGVKTFSLEDLPI